MYWKDSRDKGTINLFPAVKLGLMAAGKNISDFADKTLRLISPRLLPVMAEDEAAEDDQVSCTFETTSLSMNRALNESNWEGNTPLL